MSLRSSVTHRSVTHVLMFTGRAQYVAELSPDAALDILRASRHGGRRGVWSHQYET